MANFLKSRYLDLFLPSLAALILIGALFPFVNADREMDYDGVGNVCKAYVSGPPRSYAPTRQPGSPTYDLSLALYCKGLQVLGIDESRWLYWQQWLSTILFIAFLYFFYFDLRNFLSAGAGFLALLSLALHPLVLWFAWAAVEDMPALVLGYIGFFLLRNLQPRHWVWASLVLAAAATTKLSALGFFFASIFWSLAHRKKSEALTFIGFTSLLAALLYLPALVYFKMDLVSAISMPHHEIPFQERPGVGWDLIRFTFLWWVPGTLFVGVDLFRRLILKKGDPKIQIVDLFLVIFCVLGFFNIYSLKSIFLLMLVVAFFYWALESLRKRGLWDFVGSKVFTHSTIVGFVTLQIFLSPYSRSYFLLALPSATLLLALRFKSIQFWLSMLLVSYLPMFYYFEIRVLPPFVQIRSHGYYRSHLEGRTSEYNDGGMYHIPSIIKWPN